MFSLQFFIVIFGLALFEIISSIDNAIVNAHVLKTLPERFRKFFLFWGILFAVFVVRGVLPFLIIWLANPALSLVEVWQAAFSSTGEVGEYLEESKPLLLLSGGMYLFLVFLAWLFLETKNYAIHIERFIHRHGFWFYFLSSF